MDGTDRKPESEKNETGSDKHVNNQMGGFPLPFVPSNCRIWAVAHQGSVVPLRTPDLSQRGKPDAKAYTRFVHLRQGTPCIWGVPNSSLRQTHTDLGAK